MWFVHIHSVLLCLNAANKIQEHTHHASSCTHPPPACLTQADQSQTKAHLLHVPFCETQVEACDVFEGFLMLQSMAGGTGAGAGTYMAHALADDYSSAHLLNCCVW
jgi:hypothetical protein